MTTATTILIVPAWSDQAGQCRIVARDHDDSFVPGLVDYRRNPDLWAEVGLMNSRGELVHFDGTMAQLQELRDSQPLMAGTTFHYPAVSA